MERTINKDIIIDSSRKCLEKLLRSLKATKDYYQKTQLKELQRQIAYALKLEQIQKEKASFNGELTLGNYALAMNVSHLRNNYHESEYLTRMIPGSTIVSAISNLDDYVYHILHVLLDNDPNLASVVEIKLPYKDIRGLETALEIREYCIATYMEGLFCGSHDELFETISKKFNLSNIKKIQGYKDFLFVTELRNIIVHHDSKFSLKFKVNMEKYHIDYEKYSFFDEDGYISLNTDGILWCIDICVSVALQLYLEICDHYAGKNQKLIDKYTNEINSICVDLISSGYSHVCCVVYDFLLSRFKSTKDHYLFSINKALCLKRIGNIDAMVALISGIDWAESPEQYIFAKHILLGNFNEAVEYMDKVPLDVWECGYQDWPLCTELVQTELFRIKYEAIYGYPYKKSIMADRLKENEIEQIIADYRKSLT